MAWLGHARTIISGVGSPQKKSAERIRIATEQVLEEGKAVTYDLGGKAKTSEMGAAIADKVRSVDVRAASLMHA